MPMFKESLQSTVAEFVAMMQEMGITDANEIHDALIDALNDDATELLEEILD